MGRPRLRWLEKDLWEMNVKRWRQKVVNREEWVSIINRPRLSKGRGAQY